jgi:hypothetical protein
MTVHNEAAIRRSAEQVLVDFLLENGPDDLCDLDSPHSLVVSALAVLRDDLLAWLRDGKTND